MPNLFDKRFFVALVGCLFVLMSYFIWSDRCRCASVIRPALKESGSIDPYIQRKENEFFGPSDSVLFYYEDSVPSVNGEGFYLSDSSYLGVVLISDTTYQFPPRSRLIKMTPLHRYKDGSAVGVSDGISTRFFYSMSEVDFDKKPITAIQAFKCHIRVQYVVLPAKTKKI